MYMYTYTYTSIYIYICIHIHVYTCVANPCNPQNRCRKIKQMLNSGTLHNCYSIQYYSRLILPAIAVIIHSWPRSQNVCLGLGFSVVCIYISIYIYKWPIGQHQEFWWLPLRRKRWFAPSFEGSKWPERTGLSYFSLKLRMHPRILTWIWWLAAAHPAECTRGPGLQTQLIRSELWLSLDIGKDKQQMIEKIHPPSKLP